MPVLEDYLMQNQQPVQPIEYSDEARKQALWQGVLQAGLAMMADQGKVYRTKGEARGSGIASLGKAGQAGLKGYNEALGADLKNSQTQELMNIKRKTAAQQQVPKDFKFTGASVFRGNDGNWWRWNPKTGDAEFLGVNEKGENSWMHDPSKPVPDAVPKELGRTPAGLLDKGVQLDSIKGNLERIKTNLNDDWIGPVAGRAYRLQEAVTGLKDDTQSIFYADVNDLGDMLLRARSGAQINEQEYARLRKLVPTPDLPPKVFKERLTRFEAQLNQILDARKRRLGAGRYLSSEETTPARSSAPVKKSVSEMTDEELLNSL